MNNDMINNAILYATNRHWGQTRRDGSPYIMHPLRVAHLVQTETNDSEVIAAAILHDTIEDTDATYDAIADIFSKRVADLVLELTTDEEQKNKVGKKVYLAEKMKRMSDDALLIKLCDRLDNVSDLKTANNSKWVAKYSDQTLHILVELDKCFASGERSKTESMNNVMRDIAYMVRY